MKTFLRGFLIAATMTLLPMAVFASPVNINIADAATLAEAIVGVGPKTAEKIIEYRDANGPFKTVEDLLNVDGIGPKTIEKNRDKLVVESTVQQ